MAKNDSLANSALNKSGQGSYGSPTAGSRTVYPAIVVPYGTNDNSEQNRIKARIVAVDDETGKIKGKSASLNEENYNNYSGRDRTILDGDLVLCMPLLPEFFHVRPQVGEMVFVIMENPQDNSAVRYWIGPIATSQLKLNYQGFEDSYKMFNKTSFVSNPTKNSSLNLDALLPGQADVAIQGRNDADLILKNREAFLVAGKFEDYKNFIVNTEHQSFLRLKQVNNTNNPTEPKPRTVIKNRIDIELNENTRGEFEGKITVVDVNSNYQLINEKNSYKDRANIITWLSERLIELKHKYPNWEFNSKVPEFKNQLSNYNSVSTPEATTPPINNQALLEKYSQASLASTNINIYSPRGKFRGDDIKSFEINEDLKSFGNFANSLHPAVFGDELIRVLDLIIRIVLTHIHTPQNPLLQTSLSNELKKYTVDGYLQNLISNHIRIN